MALFPTLPGTLRTQPREQRMRAWGQVGESNRALWMTASLAPLAGALMMIGLAIFLQGEMHILSPAHPFRIFAINSSTAFLTGYIIFRLFFFRRIERAAEGYFAAPETSTPDSGGTTGAARV